MDEVIPPNVDCFCQNNHRKIKPGAARGAGEGTLSVESRCPRRKLCGGVNPSNPPLPAMGFAPPATQQRFARRDMEDPLPHAERHKIEECSAGTAQHSSVNS